MSTTHTNVTIHRGVDRGRSDHGWLQARHSFSFGHYHDPDNMGYRALRVLNDDVIAGGGGFPRHPHRDMEILTWVLDGALRHEDSTGGGGVIRPGELQAMTAGTGIEHSEMNGSADEPVHLLQIWITPERPGLAPHYAQRSFDLAGRRDRWQVLAAGADGDDGLRIHQDATLRVTNLSPDSEVPLATSARRLGYVHVAQGDVTLDGDALTGGDAARITGPTDLTIRATTPAQVLWFDLS